MFDLVVYEFENMPDDEEKCNQIVQDTFKSGFIHVRDKESGKYYVASIMSLNRPKDIEVKKTSAKNAKTEKELEMFKFLSEVIAENIGEVVACWNIPEEEEEEEEEANAES